MTDKEIRMKKGWERMEESGKATGLLSWMYSLVLSANSWLKNAPTKAVNVGKKNEWFVDDSHDRGN